MTWLLRPKHVVAQPPTLSLLQKGGLSPSRLVLLTDNGLLSSGQLHESRLVCIDFIETKRVHDDAYGQALDKGETPLHGGGSLGIPHLLAFIQSCSLSHFSRNWEPCRHRWSVHPAAGLCRRPIGSAAPIAPGAVGRSVARRRRDLWRGRRRRGRGRPPAARRRPAASPL